MNTRSDPTASTMLLGAAALCVAWFQPLVAAACPMCFNGSDGNADAFLYGSLFLMFVPVTAIGSLVYWAYRRIKAQNESPDVPPPASIPVAVADVRALRIVSRRD
jgi:hypothetical protein